MMIVLICNANDIMRSRLLLTWILFLGIVSASEAVQNSEILSEINITEKFGMFKMLDSDIPQNSEFPFEYLLKESSVTFEQTDRGIVAVIDHLIRLKVFTDDPVSATQASIISIPYYFAENMESVTSIRGITYNQDGTFNVLDNNTLRTVDLNSRYRIMEFEMPEVRQGSVIEYAYTVRRRYIEELPDFHFSHRVPVQEANLYIKHVDYMRYNSIEENIDFTLNYNEHRVDTSSIPHVFTYQRPDPIYIETWQANDIPAIDAVEFVSSLNDIRGKLKFQISEFGIPRQSLENSWEFVTAQIRRHNNPFQIVNRNSELLELGESLFDDISDMSVRQDSIFQYVNQRVQFNELGAVFADSDLSHVLAGEPADQAEINMLLLTLLRGAGLEAKPLYISGREFGRINKSFPSLYQFNRMLVISDIDGTKRFMDASYSYSMPDLIPVISYNEQGMIFNGTDYEWVEIVPDRSLFHLGVDINAELSAEGDLSGTLSATVRGYPAREIRSKISRGVHAEEIIAETFFEAYSDLDLATSSVLVNDQNRNEVSVKTDFMIQNYSITYTDGIEFRPMVVGYLFSNPFESTVRNTPVTLDAPEKLSINYSIRLPAGFETDVAGETRSTSLRGAELFEEYLVDGSLIEYSFDINISQKEFPSDQYAELRRLYERWVNLSNDIWFIEK